MTKKQHWPVVLNKFADISFKENSTGSGLLIWIYEQRSKNYTNEIVHRVINSSSNFNEIDLNVL